ncbi:MAG TPA: ComF family protein [Candidatus Dormibacteraeota bacterium]|nr:ComF family protein [Candidatus Dormibacteraeota bacterium]
MRVDLLELLLPPRCGGCRSVGSWLCGRCRARIRPLEEPLCRRCGVEVESARAECGCRARLRSISRLRSAAAYDGPVESAIHRFKYQGWRRLAGPLALLMAERLAVEGLAARFVLGVPLHPARLRERGFNQADLLAGELRRRLRLGAPPGELVRTRPTPPQVGHDRVWRLANVRAAFEWRGEPLDGSPVLLVDDVATTGATLDACASALRAAGSGPVMGISIARVNV